MTSSTPVLSAVPSLRLGLSALLVATTAAFTAAQDPTSLPFELHATKISPGPHAVDAAPDSLWANGRDYKASFHDGFVLYPFVGPTLPHQPFAWRTVSVRAGERELHVAPRLPTPRIDGFRCAYDLGAVVEQYEVRDDGVEQSFVVSERPAAGDLVITGEVTTPLMAKESPAQHGSLVFTLADGRPVVGYGAAFAIDANGTRTPVTTARKGNRIELRVAADVVARAAFPLLVDPLIGSQIVGLGVGPVEDLDVLYEQLTPPASQAGTWYTWTIEVAAGDRDVRLWRTGDAFAGTVIAAHEAITLDDDRRGAIGLCSTTADVVFAYQHFSNGIIANVIRIHAHPVATLTALPGYQTVPIPVLGGFATADDTRPDVGGSLSPTDARILVTFQRDTITPGNPGNTPNTAAMAQIFDASQYLTPGAFPSLASSLRFVADGDQERVVTNQTSADGTWLVAMQEMDNLVSNDDWDVEIVEVNVLGVAIATGFATAHAADITTHAIEPQIAGSGGRYLVTYTTRAFEQTNPKPTGTKGSAVHAQRFDWDPLTNSGSLPHPAVTLLTIANNGLDNGGIAYDRISESHWCTTLSFEAGARHRVHKLGYTGNIVEALPIQLAAGRRPDAIAATFDSRVRQFPIVYSETDTTTNACVVTGTMLDYEPAALPQLLGFACGSGVWDGVTALRTHQQVGSENASMQLTGAPENTLAILIASTVRIDADGALIGAPGCTIVPDLANGFITFFVANIVNGHAEVLVDLPESSGPGVVFFQWAYFATGANPLNMQFSEGLRLDIDN